MLVLAKGLSYTHTHSISNTLMLVLAKGLSYTHTHSISNTLMLVLAKGLSYTHTHSISNTLMLVVKVLFLKKNTLILLHEFQEMQHCSVM